MRVTWQAVASLLVDPVDQTPLLLESGDVLRSSGGRTYRLVGGQPVLLPEAGHVSAWRFPPITVEDVTRPKPMGTGRSAVKAYQRWIRNSIGKQGASPRFLELVRDAAVGERPLVLIVGGATIGDGCEAVVHAPDLDVATFDVYPTDVTTFVADAHHIPLLDGSASAVWIQAVLEHVVEPERVVREIARVIRPGGVVYAETPFLQPVHEGPYDFQRFTLSAHRLLFAGFDEIEAGPLGGPASLLNLSVRGVVGGLTRSGVAARLAYIATQPLALLDRFIPTGWRRDFATGSYFLGRRISDEPREFDAVAYYGSVR